MPSSKKKILLTSLALPALVLFLFGAHLSGIIDFHEGDAVDLHFKIRGKQKADEQITVVAIDDSSIAALGQWPWPRSIHAAFLDLISRYHPKNIFFDILFTEAGANPNDDKVLAAAIQKSANVTLPFFYTSENPFKAQYPLDLFRKQASALTYVNATTDPDGKIRRTKGSVSTPDGIFYSPAITMAGKTGESFKTLPLDRNGNIQINFPGEITSFRTLSFGQIVSAAGLGQEDNLKEWLENRYVLIGHAATGTADLKSVPFSNFMPGVAVHASLLHTLLSGKYLREVSFWLQLILLFGLAYSSSLIFRKLKPAKGFLALAAYLTAYFAANYILFLIGWIAPLYVPMVLLAFVYALTLFGKYTEIYVQKEIAARELAMAARIQEQFLPQAKPQFPNLDVAYETRFLKEVGGDLYDWFALKDGRFSFCVGDVSGKGMPAAIYMAKTLSDLRSIDKNNRTAGAVCTELNRILIDNPAAGMFLTLFYGILDPKTKRLQFSSAGHEPAVLFRKTTGVSELLHGAQGVPLGMFEAEYESEEILLEEGDSLLLYTDGVKELRNKKREEFGAQRLCVSMNAAGVKKLDASAHLMEILQSMQKHQETVSAHDDCTLFCLQFKNE